MTKKQQAAWQARRDELERRDRQQREAVIAEVAAGDPDATLQAMAAEILRYRARLAEARRRPAAGSAISLRAIAGLGEREEPGRAGSD